MKNWRQLRSGISVANALGIASVSMAMMLSVGVVTGAAAEDHTVWLVRGNWDFDDTLPKNFRTMQSPLKTKDNAKLPSEVGLKDLHLSASAEFSNNALEKSIKAIGDHKITVLDLRQEPHAFIDGKPISWFAGHDDIDAGKTVPQIDVEEKKRLAELSKSKEATTYVLINSTKPGVYREGVKPESVAVSNLKTEKELCKVDKVGYWRIAIPHDHGPDDAQVDEFVDWVKKNKDEWLHVHCTDGKGRTTSMLVMYDMMHNANKVPMDDILTRQHLLGGADLLNAKSDVDWKEADYEARTAFITKFYAYCKEQIPTGFKKSWTSWLAEHKDKAKS